MSNIGIIFGLIILIVLFVSWRRKVAYGISTANNGQLIGNGVSLRIFWSGATPDAGGSYYFETPFDKTTLMSTSNSATFVAEGTGVRVTTAASPYPGQQIMYLSVYSFKGNAASLTGYGISVANDNGEEILSTSQTSKLVQVIYQAQGFAIDWSNVCVASSPVGGGYTHYALFPKNVFPANMNDQNVPFEQSIWAIGNRFYLKLLDYPHGCDFYNSIFGRLMLYDGDSTTLTKELNRITGRSGMYIAVFLATPGSSPVAYLTGEALAKSDGYGIKTYASDGTVLFDSSQGAILGIKSKSNISCAFHNAYNPRVLAETSTGIFAEQGQLFHTQSGWSATAVNGTCGDGGKQGILAEIYGAVLSRKPSGEIVILKGSLYTYQSYPYTFGCDGYSSSILLGNNQNEL